MNLTSLEVAELLLRLRNLRARAASGHSYVDAAAIHDAMSVIERQQFSLTSLRAQLVRAGVTDRPANHDATVTTLHQGAPHRGR